MQLSDGRRRKDFIKSSVLDSESPPKLLLASGSEDDMGLELLVCFSPCTLYAELPGVLPPVAAGSQGVDSLRGEI